MKHDQTRPTRPQRLDVQGLRAVAVLLVVGFHLAPNTISGGYVGVDVFFVISGFLITGHLVREIERTGTVRLRDFWARRARRLLPVALVVLVVSTAAVLVFLPPSTRIQNLWEIALAAVYVLNWNLAANSVDYLASDNAASIAQHYWSLSIEEQFYIIWPLLLLIAIWGAAKVSISRKTVIRATLIVVFAASLAFSIYETLRSQPSAYFVTTTRAWEFAAGGLVALLPLHSRLLPALRAGISWLALIAITAAAFLFDASTLFPGWIALVPVLGTALLLWVGESDSPWSPQYVSHARPIQFIGDTSYSIYLWHWPLIVVFVAIKDRMPGWKWAFVLFACTLLLAWLSKRFVEDPIRFGSRAPKRSTPIFLMTATAMTAVVAIAILPIQMIRAQDVRVSELVAAGLAETSGCFGAYSVTNDCSAPYARTESVSATATAEDSYAISGPASTEDCTQEQVAQRLQVVCNLNSPVGPTKKAMLVGDSHVDHFAAPMQQVAKDLGWALSTVRRAGCSSFAEHHADAGDPACAQWGDATYATIIADESIDLVLVANRAPLYRSPHDQARASAQLDALVTAGKEVVVLRTVPGMQAEWPIIGTARTGPECVDRSNEDDPCSWRPPSEPDWLMTVALERDIPIIDTWGILCSDDGVCHTVIGGTIAYFDDNHLATSFAMSLRPWLKEELLTLQR